MYIFMKNLIGRTTIVEVESYDVAEDLKFMIQDKFGFPPKKQCLVFNGRELEDGCTLHLI